jgi:hypothetical protein
MARLTTPLWRPPATAELADGRRGREEGHGKRPDRAGSLNEGKGRVTAHLRGRMPSRVADNAALAVQ